MTVDPNITLHPLSHPPRHVHSQALAIWPLKPSLTVLSSPPSTSSSPSPWGSLLAFWPDLSSPNPFSFFLVAAGQFVSNGNLTPLLRWFALPSAQVQSPSPYKVPYNVLSITSPLHLLTCPAYLLAHQDRHVPRAGRQNCRLATLARVSPSVSNASVFRCLPNFWFKFPSSAGFTDLPTLAQTHPYCCTFHC